ncbi:hypothetical protein A9D60_21625 [Leisingera sp. JC1]|nr:hypothetical protein A9D60_21625 [Leisingera sp. JC1]
MVAISHIITARPELAGILLPMRHKNAQKPDFMHTGCQYQNARHILFLWALVQGAALLRVFNAIGRFADLLGGCEISWCHLRKLTFRRSFRPIHFRATARQQRALIGRNMQRTVT